jgi:signal transduction histidine kinase
MSLETQAVGLDRRPRLTGGTLAVFIGLMLVLGGSLIWLGWQWLKQDRELEGNRLRESLDLAADQMAVALQRDLSGLESLLAYAPGPGAEPPPDGVLVLRAADRAIETFPSGALLYVPVAPNPPEPPSSTFAPGETLEHQRRDPAGAAALFRAQARSSDPVVQAGAWLRLGRNLRKLGRADEALRAYDELAKLGATPTLGLPAELAAMAARCSVLEETRRTEGLRREAGLLRAALWSGRWRLPRPAWEFYRGEAARWDDAPPPTEREREALALAMAAEAIYGQWRAGAPSRGRRILMIDDRPVMALWSGAPDHLAAVLAGPRHLAGKWTAALGGRRLQAALIDADGRVLLGSLKGNGPRTVRTAAETKLPGNLHAAGLDPAPETALYRGRRRFLFGVFSLLSLALLAGSFFISRSLARERAVARLQSEFVSAVSHEFRTPLTALRQLSEMLSTGRIADDGLRQKSYGILSQESERLQRLVESLLDFGRIEAGTLRYRFEPLDPGEWISGVVAEFQDKVSARGYRIETSLAAGLPPLHADRESLGLALRNLLDNAVKYSPDFRTVWVDAARDGDKLAVSVKDQGMGIPASEHKAVFRRFVRGSGSQAAQIQGTGIGLALARHIVQAHGGDIRLRSEPGRGSTFTILLPLETRT